MKDISFYIRLLLLLSIFFLYRLIIGFVENNQFEIIFWSIILGIYVPSLIILSFITKKYQNRKQKVS